MAIRDFLLLLFKVTDLWDFSGGPVAKTLISEFRRPRFDPWSGK